MGVKEGFEGGFRNEKRVDEYNNGKNDAGLCKGEECMGVFVFCTGDGVRSIVRSLALARGVYESALSLSLSPSLSLSLSPACLTHLTPASNEERYIDLEGRPTSKNNISRLPFSTTNTHYTTHA